MIRNIEPIFVYEMRGLITRFTDSLVVINRALSQARSQKMQTLRHQRCMSLLSHLTYSRSDLALSWFSTTKWFEEATWTLCSLR